MEMVMRAAVLLFAGFVCFCTSAAAAGQQRPPMTPEQQAVEQHLSKPAPITNACACVGRQNDDPLCHCAMQWVEKVDGKYYEITYTRTETGITVSAELLK